jgi:hypothetical protein
MLLAPQDAQLFFKLHRALLYFVNQRLQIVPDLASPEGVADVAPEVGLKLRDALLDETDLVEIFIDQNPGGLADDELDIVLSWRHLMPGEFYIFRYLKKYTVFLSTDKQPIAYGVVALTQPLEWLIGPYLPVLTKTVLLPFKNQIVYDGLLNSYPISFGPGIRRSLNESYNEAKDRNGIVTTLPRPASGLIPPPTRIAKPRRRPVSKEAVGRRRSDRRHGQPGLPGPSER